MDYRSISLNDKVLNNTKYLRELNKPTLESIMPGDLHVSRSPGLEYEVANKSFKLDASGMIRMIQISLLSHQLLTHTITGIKKDWADYNRSKLESLIGKSGQEIVEALNTNGWFGRSKLKTPDSAYFREAMVFLSNFMYRLKEDRIKSVMLKLFSVVENSCKDIGNYGSNTDTLKKELDSTRKNISDNIQSLSMVMNLALTQCYIARQLGKMNTYHLIIKTINSSFKELNVDLKECYSTTYEYSTQPAEDLFSNEGKKLLIRSGSDKDIPSVLETMLDQGVLVPIINHSGRVVAKPEVYEEFDLNLLVNKDNIDYSKIAPLTVTDKITEVSDLTMLMLNLAIAVGMFESVFFQLKVK